MQEIHKQNNLDSDSICMVQVKLRFIYIYRILTVLLITGQKSDQVDYQQGCNSISDVINSVQIRIY
ncbi:unnamed protein product [Paramecium octaurelia]|uniref:Uncharacterized protein n=1 Tax=Paramecium octaurelia TaxID=43137 RepID=A0A8S1T9V4_PAROT|nr:unnamed protein product [Paramecium octaurelia]